MYYCKGGRDTQQSGLVEGGSGSEAGHETQESWLEEGGSGSEAVLETQQEAVQETQHEYLELKEPQKHNKK